MKKIIPFLLCVPLCLPALAQQKPMYTQYMLNQYIINPAITGIENYTDIRISHRHQWTGIQDAPVTTYFTVHTPIGKSDFRTTPTSFRAEGENPRGQAYWENYTAASPHHGIGLQVINDRTGPINQFGAYISYAYHLGISPRTSLSAGFGAGVNNISLNAGKLDFDVPVDPAVYNSGMINRLKPDFNAGLYLYSDKFFAGLSAQQIIPQKIRFTGEEVGTASGKLVPHLFATAGYRFLLGEDFNFLPSLLVKYISPLPVQADINVKLQYRDLAWIGAGFRVEDGFAGMAGLNISNTVNVSYAYDYTTSGLNNFSKGTHEIMVGFLLGNSFGDWCPRNVW